MSKWRETTLAEIALDGDAGFVDGPFGSNLPAKLYTESGIPVIRGSNLTLGPSRFDSSEFVYVAPETAKSLQRSLCVANDIVFTKKGTLGQTGLVPEDGENATYLLSSNQMRLRVDTEQADALFVYYYVSSPSSLAKINRDAEATGVPKTNLAYFRDFPITMPDLPEQKRIAHILGTLDDKIELNRRMNLTLEAIARAIFRSWFVDFDPVIDNAVLNEKPIPDEFAKRAEVRREILARSQPSPPSPLPEVEGRSYRGGLEFAGLVERERELRHQQTPAEEIMWELLRDRRFLDLKFRRQHQIGDYIADFYCHDHKLVIELDGGIHLTKEAKDAKRDAYMQSLGLTVLRIPVLGSTKAVLSQIADVVSVSPSTAGRGGAEGIADLSPSTFGRGVRGEGVASYRHLFPDSFQDSPLGKIPKGWEVSTVGDKFLLTMGQSPPGSTYNEDGDGLPFFQGRRDFAFRFPTRRVFCSAPKRIAEAGDTLVSVRAPVGDVNMAPYQLCLGRGLAGVRHASDSRSYTYYSMLSLRDRFREFESEGTVFGAINKSQFANLLWITPPIEIVEAFECQIWATDASVVF